MLKTIRFFLPTKIIFGEDTIHDFLPEISRYGKIPLIVTGRSSVRKSGLLDSITDILNRKHITFHIYEGVSPEPSVDDCMKVAQFAIRCNADVLVAVGGGSAMDVAKAAGVLVKNTGSLQGYFGEEKFKNDPLPIVAIPTTCGTGSEVTRYSVIIDWQSGTKKTISSERIIPKMAILDPVAIKTLPPGIIAGTGMDALCHAVEGFLSIKANHLTKIFSREAITLIFDNIEKAVQQRKIEYLSNLLLGSLYAGFVINHTGTIVVHGMAYGLTIRYQLHHGTANAICLPYALEFLKNHGYEEEIHDLEKIFSIDSLFDINKKIGIPVHLSELGIQREDVDVLAEMAVIGNERAFRNMKISISKEEFVEIFSKML
ncbi:MAG TPA: iron-containing alcohol dehydrogenase [bacterium]|nr:iron-containing alcohol dehydrogenase [bacterium]HRV04211.1 iron-containing alcohol dehydrogenase [Candidatus Ratteibacteria bacterium]